MDTSGVVRVLESDTGGEKTFALYKWRNLSPFVQGYVRALFASLMTPPFTNRPHLPYANRAGHTVVGFSDLAPEALAEILKDCEAYGRYFMGVKPSENGLAFWENRQRGYLLDVAHCGNFPPLTIILAEDGKIHLKAADNG